MANQNRGFFHHGTGEFSNEFAFAAFRSDGSVVTWGSSSYPSYGANSSAVANQLNGTIDITQIFSNAYSFAALRADGSVITWGNIDSGGDSNSVTNQLMAVLMSFKCSLAILHLLHYVMMVQLSLGDLP